MTQRTRLLRRMLAMSFQVEPRRSAVNLVLVVTLAGITAASAYAQRWLVDAAETGTLAGVLGAIAYGLTASVFRVEGSLRGDISHHVAVLLSKETTATAASIPTMTHLEHPPYLDRIVIVRGGGYAIAGAAWAVLETLSQVISLGLLVWLLATVHPVLAVSILFAAVPLYMGDRARRLVRDAADATTEAERVENELHELCIEPEPAQEIRTSGAGRAVSDCADEIWAEALHRRLIAQLHAGGLQLLGWAVYIGAFAAAVAFTAALVIDQRASPGDMVMVIYLAGQLWALVQGIVQIGEGGRAMSHMLWFEDYARSAVGRGRARAGAAAGRDRAARGLVPVPRRGGRRAEQCGLAAAAGRGDRDRRHQRRGQVDPRETADGHVRAGRGRHHRGRGRPRGDRPGPVARAGHRVLPGPHEVPVQGLRDRRRGAAPRDRGPGRGGPRGRRRGRADRGGRPPRGPRLPTGPRHRRGHPHRPTRRRRPLRPPLPNPTNRLRPPDHTPEQQKSRPVKNRSAPCCSRRPCVWTSPTSWRRPCFRAPSTSWRRPYFWTSSTSLRRIWDLNP